MHTSDSKITQARSKVFSRLIDIIYLRGYWLLQLSMLEILKSQFFGYSPLVQVGWVDFFVTSQNSWFDLFVTSQNNALFIVETSAFVC